VFPTSERSRIRFWFFEEENFVHSPKCAMGEFYEPYVLRFQDEQTPISSRDPAGQERTECPQCFRERQRRARALYRSEDDVQAKDRLQNPDFAETVLITIWNDAVFTFGITAARNFAFRTGQQLFWVQAADIPPPDFVTD